MAFPDKQVLFVQSSLTRVHMMRLHGNPRTEATGAHTQDQATLERLMNPELVVKVLALSSWENSGSFLLEKVWILSCGIILVLSCWKKSRSCPMGKFWSSPVEKVWILSCGKNVGPMSALGMPIKIMYGAKSFGTRTSVDFIDKRLPMSQVTYPVQKVSNTLPEFPPLGRGKWPFLGTQFG
jgi:hypothetical protein